MHKGKPYGLVQTSLKRTPFWESSFTSLDAEVTTNNCLSEDGAKQTWRAESTIDLSAVIILISTLRTFNRTTQVLEFIHRCQFVNRLKEKIFSPNNLKMSSHVRRLKKSVRLKQRATKMYPFKFRPRSLCNYYQLGCKPYLIQRSCIGDSHCEFCWSDVCQLQAVFTYTQYMRATLATNHNGVWKHANQLESIISCIIQC